MELKYLVILTVLGAVAGFTVPQPDSESSFPTSSLGKTSALLFYLKFTNYRFLSYSPDLTLIDRW